MSALAVMLIAMGIADVTRRLTDRSWVPPIVAPAVVVACAALAGLWHAGDIVLLADRRGGQRCLGGAVCAAPSGRASAN